MSSHHTHRTLTVTVQHVGTCNDPTRCQNWIDTETRIEVHVVRNAFLGVRTGTWDAYDRNTHQRLDNGLLTGDRAAQLVTDPDSSGTVIWVAGIVDRALDRVEHHLAGTAGA